MTVYYIIEQRDRRDSAWYPPYRDYEDGLSYARGIRRQILSEKLAADVRIVRVDSKARTVKVVR